MRRVLMLPAMVLFILAGCGGYQDQEGGDYTITQDKVAPPGMPEQAPAPPQGNSGGDAPREEQGTIPEPAERKIIRNGQLTLRIQSLDSSEAALARIAAAHNGYISNSSRFRSSGNARTGTTELRIPSDRFDNALTAIRALGELENESITSTDVTREFIDLEARLKTQQELEIRLLKLLDERGGKLSDIIEIEAKLAQVRTEIEGIQGQLRFLRQQVGYSTLTVTMMEPGSVGVNSTETFGGRMQRALERGLEGLVEMIGFFITALLALLPLIVIGAILFFFVLRPWLRRRRARQMAGSTAQPPPSSQEKI